MQDKKTYWFKRRRYGYGWTPTTWQGWTLLGVWLLAVLAGTLWVMSAPKEQEDVAGIIYATLVLLSVIPLILISYKKGPQPKWRWGKSEDDDPDLDW